MANERPKKRGRPRGPETKPLLLKLTVEQERDLSILHAIMDGKPTVTGLIRTAIDRYVSEKIADPVIGPVYHNALSKPGLKLAR